MLLGSDGGDILHDIAEMTDVIGLGRGSVTRMLETVPRQVQEFKLALSAASGMACDDKTTEKYQDMIGEPIRSVVINPSGAPDPVAIMLERLASGDTGPNFAVVRYEGPDTRYRMSSCDEPEAQAKDGSASSSFACASGS